MLEYLKPLLLVFRNICYHFAEFSTLSFDDFTVDDITVARDMFTKRMVTGIVFQRLKISLSISMFDRHIFNNFVVTVIWETNILVIFNVFMKYSALISLQNMMFNVEILIIAAIHILIFGEMAGFKNSSIHSNARENEKNFSWSYEKEKKFSQSELANLHENNWY